MEKKLKAAGYARVSTVRDCQDGSFASQQAYLRDFIRRQPGLEFSGVYGDHGKSGRYMKDRQALQDLMAAAEAGEVELICYKSLSRFGIEDVVGTGLATCGALTQGAMWGTHDLVL